MISQQRGERTIAGELKCDYSSSICGWDSRAIRVLRVEVQGTGWQAEKYSRVSDGERAGGNSRDRRY